MAQTGVRVHTVNCKNTVAPVEIIPGFVENCAGGFGEFGQSAQDEVARDSG
jgi:hypothetical protein